VKRSELQNNLAMTVTLVMGSMLFATLFMGYAVYRTSATVWPPLGIPKISLMVPFLSTIVVALSSWFMYKVKVLVSQNQLQAGLKNLNFTMVLGTLFLASQGYLWFYLKNTGVFLGTSGIFGSVLYGFTWIHAVHMVMGMGALTYLKFALHSSAPNKMQKTINVEKFWHFLGLIWFIMFLIIFVL